jgi:hypothetical protein
MHTMVSSEAMLQTTARLALQLAQYQLQRLYA